MCQCPRTGNAHFYRRWIRESTMSLESVNALKRATLISTSTMSELYSNVWCVNALKRATLISTALSLLEENAKDIVSMPSNGQRSFLLDTATETESGEVCQCPQTGNAHFYGSEVSPLYYRMLRVNALKRATLISTRRHQRRHQRRHVSMPSNGQRSFLHLCGLKMSSSSIVSMPSNGQRSFLRRYVRLGEAPGGGVSMPSNGQRSFLQLYIMATTDSYPCQCPQTGNAHFYIVAYAVMEKPDWCVNALKRATLISTN